MIWGLLSLPFKLISFFVNLAWYILRTLLGIGAFLLSNIVLLLIVGVIVVVMMNL